MQKALLTDTLTRNYDLVYASAVLLHFTRRELAVVLKKVAAALNDGGKFAFSLKNGEGEKWSTEKLGAPRFFCYWTAEHIEEFLRDAGYTSWDIHKNKSIQDDAIWLSIIAVK